VLSKANEIKRMSWLKKNKHLWPDHVPGKPPKIQMIKLAEEARACGLYSQKTLQIDIISGLRSKIKKLKDMKNGQQEIRKTH